MSRARKGAAFLAVGLVLAGCARSELAGSTEADRLGARRALATAASTGPVPLLVRGDPDPLTPADLPELAARGIAGLAPAFVLAPHAVTAPRLVLWFDPPAGASAAAACARAEPGRSPASPTRLLAAWCEDAYPVASVAGTAAEPGWQAAERLVWRSTARLFPDDYAETYGFNLLGWRVRLGGSASF